MVIKLSFNVNTFSQIFSEPFRQIHQVKAVKWSNFCLRKELAHCKRVFIQYLECVVSWRLEGSLSQVCWAPFWPQLVAAFLHLFSGISLKCSRSAQDSTPWAVERHYYSKVVADHAEILKEYCQFWLSIKIVRKKFLFEELQCWKRVLMTWITSSQHLVVFFSKCVPTLCCWQDISLHEPKHWQENYRLWSRW